MKIFNYDENGYFTDVSNAHPNQLEKGKYLIPSRASTMSPPTHDRQTQRAKYIGNNQWKLESRVMVSVNGQRVELTSMDDLKKIAAIMLKETDDEIMEHFEDMTAPSNDVIMYRRKLRQVMRGTSNRLPRLLRVPKWPALKGNK